MAATTTYVTIVNNAVIESGADLATFDSGGSDFTTNTNSLLQKMKVWVQRAWKDIQVQCWDWEFMQEQGLCNILPGIMFFTDGTPVSTFAGVLANSTFDIYDQDGTVAIPSISAGSFTDLTGTATLTLPFGYFNISGANQQTPLNIALKPGAENFTLAHTSGTISGTISIVNSATFPGVFDVTVAGVTYPGAATVTSNSSNTTTLTALLGQAAITAASTVGHIVMYSQGGTNYWSQTVSSSSLAAVGTYTAYIHSWKSFNFDEENQTGDFEEDIQEINQKSFRVVDYFQAPPAGEVPVPFMAWETFRSSYDQSAAYPGLPRLVTEDDTGRYRFWPSPYYQFTMKFDYARLPQILNNYNDIPRGLDDDFMDLIMWKALIYYGEFDEQPSVALRATKNYRNLLNRLENKNREKYHFKPVKLW